MEEGGREGDGGIEGGCSGVIRCNINEITGCPLKIARRSSSLDV